MLTSQQTLTQIYNTEIAYRTQIRHQQYDCQKENPVFLGVSDLSYYVSDHMNRGTSQHMIKVVMQLSISVIQDIFCAGPACESRALESLLKQKRNTSAFYSSLHNFTNYIS